MSHFECSFIKTTLVYVLAVLEVTHSQVFVRVRDRLLTVVLFVRIYGHYPNDGGANLPAVFMFGQ